MSRSVACEQLEIRRLYAGIKLVGHVLEVGGAGASPNTITVGLAPGGSSIEANLSYPLPHHKGTHTVSKTVALGAVSLLYIVGGKAADVITIDQTNGSFPVPTRILTGNGNDTAVGGDEPDSIVGGIGTDILMGGGGDDTIYGEIGNDTIVGGTGDDTLHGGRGFDRIDGSAGANDVIIGGHGGDTLLGGTGVNTFFVMSIQSDTTNYRPYIDNLHKVTKPPKSSSSSFWDNLGGILPFL